VESITSLGLPNKARTMSYADVEEELKLKFKNGTYCDKRATAEFVNGMIAPWIHPEFEVSRLSRAAIATDTNHTLELAPHHSNISAPTLLLWASPGGGQHAEYARQLADDIPQAEIQWIHRASHWVMQDRPDAYRKGVQDFLDNKSA
jgi:pimeloyl-ACP methyl ester carboxylesterase